MEFSDDHGDGFIAMPLPVLPATVDFKAYELLLRKIDQILQQSGMEEELGDIAVSQKMAEISTADEKGVVNSSHHRRYASHAVRCTIARFLTQESYRKFSVHLGDSILLRSFCGYNSPHSSISTPSKSALQRFEICFGTDIIRKVTDMVMQAAMDTNSNLHNNSDGLLWGADPEVWLLDSTCVKLDIHFPVDWVLLKDCIKSILQIVIQLRKYGIKHRIPSPESFLSKINKLSMKMTNVSKRAGSKKERKTTFREMKKMLEKIEIHGLRYLNLLKEEWEKHNITELQKNQIVSKLEHTLELVPDVIHQAYERIIGERQVNNEDKILSIHEEHAQVYNRGKAGAQIEFGLQLLLGENIDGLITHWELIDGIPKADTKHVESILSRIEELPEKLKPLHLVGDRGFYSASTEKKIEKADLISNMCPKDPKELAKRLGDECFAELAKRRAQTEARIGIFKNNFLGKKLTAKGFDNQQRQVAWAILSHNLWVLARFPYKDLVDKLIA